LKIEDLDIEKDHFALVVENGCNVLVGGKKVFYAQNTKARAL
jgi:hypothetical protein